MNKKFELILISTCCNHNHIYNLINSVVSSNVELSTCLLIVNQHNIILQIPVGLSISNIIVIEHNKMENSSVARNIGISYILKQGIEAKFIAFPDDDSSYDNFFFEGIKDKIVKGDNYNIITDVYCTGTNNLFRKIKYQNNALLSKYDYNIVGAVNLVLNFQTFISVGYFDSRYGINAKYGAGEDGDYFIRATKFYPFYYNKELYSYHPSNETKYLSFTFKQLRKRLSTYGCGVIALLSKHRMYKQAFIVLIRAILGSAFYLRKGKPKISFAYFEAFFVRGYYLLHFLLKPIN